MAQKLVLELDLDEIDEHDELVRVVRNVADFLENVGLPQGTAFPVKDFKGDFVGSLELVGEREEAPAS